MEIGSYAVGSKLIRQDGPEAAPGRHALGAVGPQTQVAQRDALNENSHYTYAPELLLWLAQLAATPQVRPDEVARAAAGVSDGTYLSSEAADRAADALLG